MKLISARVAVASVLLSAALSACVVAPAPGYYGDVAVTDVAPPPPQYEAVGVAPAPGYVWIGGAWFWGVRRPGLRSSRTEAGRPGYLWVPHTWRRDGNRWHMQGGRWE